MRWSKEMRRDGGRRRWRRRDKEEEGLRGEEETGRRQG